MAKQRAGRKVGSKKKSKARPPAARKKAPVKKKSATAKASKAASTKPAGANKPAAPKKSSLSAASLESLKNFVRSKVAPKYLADKNITSVGIGLKSTSGKRTGQVAIQFTVARKAVPEMLASLETQAIPESFEVNGVTVPTDVVQRTFEASFKLVAESEGGPRKTRVDPILPGISVANQHVSAGTIGGIVYDARLGTPYVLSNWHVLHGPRGKIGDDVVQPGRHDDNRTERNRLGALVTCC